MQPFHTPGQSLQPEHATISYPRAVTTARACNHFLPQGSHYSQSMQPFPTTGQSLQSEHATISYHRAVTAVKASNPFIPQAKLIGVETCASSIYRSMGQYIDLPRSIFLQTSSELPKPCNKNFKSNYLVLT